MKVLNAYYKLFRVTNLLITALSLYLFYYLIIIPVHENILEGFQGSLNNIQFLLFTLAVVLIAAAGNIINDYYDLDTDKINRPDRPLPSGAVSPDAALTLHAFLAAAGIGIGFYLGYMAGSLQMGFMFLIPSVLLYLYSVYLKKVPLIGNLLIAALTALPFALLILFEARLLSSTDFVWRGRAFEAVLWQFYFYGGFAFTTNLAREMVKDLEDIKGDEECGVSTFAVQFGETTARYATFIALLVLAALMVYFLNLMRISARWKEIAYLTATVVFPVLFSAGMLLKAHEKKHYSRISLVLKMVMLFGILSMPVFYWLHQ